MSWPPEDPDMWAVEARFKSPKATPKETSEKEEKTIQRGPKGNGPPMQVYTDYN